jgi:hypothetical protein
MGQKFCNGCGAALHEEMKFCENCGIPVNPPAPEESQPHSSAIPPQPVAFSADAPPPPSSRFGKLPIKIVAGIVIVLIISAVIIFVLLPKISASPVRVSTGKVPATGTTTLMTTVPITTMATSIAPTPAPDPFPNALFLKSALPFGEGKIASEGTVYRVWINETYHWHNDMDNKYYLQKPKPGNKYLFVFVNVFNKGDMRTWPPNSGNVVVNYNGQDYYPDPTHYLPDKSSDRKATAIEVQEIQYFSKLFGSEYVEDFGYSHGTELAYLYPGRSNAIDGYIVFEVPASLTPDKAYAKIEFNGYQVGVWKLG